MFSLTLALLTPTAAACGGFFCNNIEPVKQKGETVVFEVDKAENHTTMHVQVEYEGPPTEFAWVIPVRGLPNLALSNEALFTKLEPRTRPQFNLQNDSSDGTCSYWWGYDDSDANVPAPPEAPSPGGVDVLAEQRVGPYETVVLAAEDTDVLLEWLQDHSYAVPNGMASVIAPYLADGHNFVALRLASGESVGDLEPLAMTYEGTVPAIPLHLTSVAATEDMRLVTYVLADARAVPDNYLHVSINYAAIDWFSWFANNYDDVVTRAADQAGGHAFATDFSSTTASLQGMFYNDDIKIEDFQVDNAEGFIAAVTGGALPASSELLTVLEELVPIPEPTDARAVYNCPSCYSTELAQWYPTFDGMAAAGELDEAILEPLRQIEAMFERQPHITRLSSSISPNEMTLDPMFTLNEDLPQEMPRIHTATLVAQCEEDVNWDDLTAQLVLPDGMVIDLPSRNTLNEQGIFDYSTYLNRLGEPAASLIESYGSTGGGTILFDGEVEIRSLIADLNEQTRELEGGRTKGCSTTNGAGMAGLLLLPALLLGRRR